VIVSNRIQPPGKEGGQAGGLAVALREALRRESGLWLGWSGEVDAAAGAEARVLAAGRIAYATLDLTPAEHRDYYLGFSNRVLWPLFHYRLGLLEFERRELAVYRQVNRRFVRALLPLLEPGDTVWVHDYHLIPFATELRALGFAGRLGFFLHIPFPAPEVLAALPSHAELVADLLAYDLIGFQTEGDARALREYVVQVAAGTAAAGRVAAFGRTAAVGAFPISIDTAFQQALAHRSEERAEVRRLRESLGGRRLVIGVDRLDYSKGLPQRFEAFSRLLAGWPEHAATTTLLQIAPVSRGEVARYRDLRRELEQLAGHLNGRHAEPDWVPIRYLNKAFPQASLAGFYRTARVGLVTPLRDGMNLVAKEYVAAQNPEDPGVLVLSRFAGASAELGGGALLVNPFDADEVAEALHRGLILDLEERRARWQAMMAVLRRNTITTWCDRFLAALAQTPVHATGRLPEAVPAPAF
jgi:trehalose 6-phosphate synthase